LDLTLEPVETLLGRGRRLALGQHGGRGQEGDGGTGRQRGDRTHKLHDVVPRVRSASIVPRGAFRAMNPIAGSRRGTAALLGWAPPRIKSAGSRLTFETTLPAGPTGGATQSRR